MRIEQEPLHVSLTGQGEAPSLQIDLVGKQVTITCLARDSHVTYRHLETVILDSLLRNDEMIVRNEAILISGNPTDRALHLP